MEIRGVIALAGLLLTALPAAGANEAPCPTTALADGHYKVRAIVFRSPLGFFAATSKLWSGIQLPLLKGGDFTEDDYNASLHPVADTVRSRLGSTGRVKVVVVTPSIENCSGGALDVVFSVFFFNYPKSAASFIEERAEEIERPALAAAEKNVEGRYRFAPMLGYNASTHLMGGMQATLAAAAGIFHQVHLEMLGSGSSSLFRGSLEGSHVFQNQYFGSVDYRLEFERSDIPSSLAALRKTLVTGSFVGLSKPIPIGRKEDGSSIQFRYAGSMEGGNERAGASASSGYESVKLAAGATARWGRQSASASYGVQGGAGFVKEVMDTRWADTFNLRFGRCPMPPEASGNCPDRHWPVGVEARFGAGLIQIPGHIPEPELFFGGNAVQSFIPAARDWEIRSGPFIHSIAENRFSAIGAGGTSYLAFGLTIAPTVWQKPLVPWSLLRDPDFPNAKDRALRNGVDFLRVAYEGEQPAAIEASKKLDALRPELENIGKILDGVAPGGDAAFEKKLSDASGALRLALANVASAQKSASVLPAVRGALVTLARDVSLVEAGLSDPLRSELKTHLDRLIAQERELEADQKKIDVPAAQRKAEADLASVTPILNTFLNELNALAVAPVILLDAAKMSPDPYGTRLGIGAGIRLTFFNVSVTAGYAVNPHPEPQLRQGHGAIFMSLEAVDLFR